MGPALKMRLWIWGLLVVGTTMMAFCVLYLITHPYATVSSPALSPAVKQVLGAGGCAGAVFFFISFFLCLVYDAKEAKLAWRWLRLGLGEFPRNTAERNSQRQRAYDILEPRAVQASRLFADRDSANREKANAESLAFPPTRTGKELRETRERHGQNVANLTKRFRQLVDDADRIARLYIKLWKLCEDLDMIPIDQRTSKPFENPEVFRNFVYEEAKEACR